MTSFSSTTAPIPPPQCQFLLAFSCHGCTCLGTHNFCLKAPHQAAPDYSSVSPLILQQLPLILREIWGVFLSAIYPPSTGLPQLMSRTAASGPVGASGAGKPGARVHTHTHTHTHTQSVSCFLQPTIKAAIESIPNKA